MSAEESEPVDLNLSDQEREIIARNQAILGDRIGALQTVLARTVNDAAAHFRLEHAQHGEVEERFASVEWPSKDITLLDLRCSCGEKLLLAAPANDGGGDDV